MMFFQMLYVSAVCLVKLSWALTELIVMLPVWPILVSSHQVLPQSHLQKDTGDGALRAGLMVGTVGIC